eukprot:GHVS01053513.1.p1 GENE.GHVS01053513.1~~GHVS01053513.1.p1  ORF type:complete len:626 (+),score=86.90 GHVS01053513.1:175-1878(+)
MSSVTNMERCGKTKESAVGRCAEEKATWNTWAHRVSTSTTASRGASCTDEEGEKVTKNIRGMEKSLRKRRGRKPRRRDNLELFAKTRISPLNKRGCARFPLKMCPFAHNEGDLRPSTDMCKTKMCPAFIQGRCSKSSERCSFAHSFETLRSTPSLYKARLCIFWMNGRCVAESTCRFAHGEDEIDTNSPSLLHLTSSTVEAASIAAIRPPPGQHDDSPPKYSLSPPTSSYCSLSSSSLSSCRRQISPASRLSCSQLTPANSRCCARSRRSAPAILEHNEGKEELEQAEAKPRPESREETEPADMSSGIVDRYNSWAGYANMRHSQHDCLSHDHLFWQHFTDCSEDIPITAPVHDPLVRVDAYPLCHGCLPAAPLPHCISLPDHIDAHSSSSSCLSSPVVPSFSSSSFYTPISSPSSSFCSSPASPPSTPFVAYPVVPVATSYPPADFSETSYHGDRVCDWCHGYPGGVVGGWGRIEGWGVESKGEESKDDHAVCEGAGSSSAVISTDNAAANTRSLCDMWCDMFGVVRCVRCCGARPPVFWQLDRLRSDPSIGAILTDLQAACLYID